MIDFLLSLFLLFNLQFGHAAYYADGAMEQVVRIRQAGWTVWLYHASEGWAGPYLVADCCNRIAGDCKRMRRRGIIVEVGHNTARRWGVLGLGPQHIDVGMVWILPE